MKPTRRELLGAALAAPGLLLFPRPVLAAEGENRLVSLDLLITELLLTIDAIPVATTNIPLYRRLVSSPVMPDSVEDLGPLNEPNLEFLARLAPSRILVADWQAAGLDTLTRVAPVMPIPVFAGKTPTLTHCENLLNQLATLTGRRAEAARAIASMYKAVEQASMTLTGFRRPVYICRLTRDGRNLAIFGGNGLLGDMLNRVGLRNAFTGRVNAAGVTSAPLARLADEPDAVIIHFDRGRETDIALRRVGQGALWHALPAVRNGRVIRMPVIYPNGGIRSAERFATRLALQLPAVSNG